jgi:hypothetical protein
MEANPLSFFHPRELHSTTSFLTLTCYLLQGLMWYLAWPSAVGYFVLLLLSVNFILIGRLFYEISKNEQERKENRNWFFAILRTVINLALLFLVLYRTGLL